MKLDDYKIETSRLGNSRNMFSGSSRTIKSGNNLQSHSTNNMNCNSSKNKLFRIPDNIIEVVQKDDRRTNEKEIILPYDKAPQKEISIYNYRNSNGNNTNLSFCDTSLASNTVATTSATDSYAYTSSPSTLGHNDDDVDDEYATENDDSNYDLQSCIEEVKDKIVDISNLLLPHSSSSVQVNPKEPARRVYPDQSVVEDIPIVNVNELLQKCSNVPSVTSSVIMTPSSYGITDNREENNHSRLTSRPTLLSQKSRESLRHIMLERQQEEIRYSQRNLLQKQQLLQRTQALQTQHQQRMQQQQQRPSLSMSRRNILLKHQESFRSQISESQSVSSIDNNSYSVNNSTTPSLSNTSNPNQNRNSNNMSGITRQTQSMRIGMERTMSFRQLQKREAELAAVANGISNHSYHSNSSGVTGPPSASTMERYMNYVGSGVAPTTSSSMASVPVFTAAAPHGGPLRPPLIPTASNHNISSSSSSHHNSIAGGGGVVHHQHMMNDCASIDEDFADDNESHIISNSSLQYVQHNDIGMLNHHHQSRQDNFVNNDSGGSGNRYRRFDPVGGTSSNHRIPQQHQDRGSVNRYHQSERVLRSSSNDYHRNSPPIHMNTTTHNYRGNNRNDMYHDDRQHHHYHHPPPPLQHSSMHAHPQSYRPSVAMNDAYSHRPYYNDNVDPRDYLPGGSPHMQAPPPLSQSNRYQQQYSPRFQQHEQPYQHRQQYHHHHQQQQHHQMMPSNSGHGVIGPNRKPLTLEISPGVHAPIRGSKETEDAVANGFIIEATCILCQGIVSCIADADYVLCPTCMIVSPTETKLSYHGGISVGLGFLESN